MINNKSAWVFIGPGTVMEVVNSTTAEGPRTYTNLHVGTKEIKVLEAPEQIIEWHGYGRGGKAE